MRILILLLVSLAVFGQNNSTHSAAQLLKAKRFTEAEEVARKTVSDDPGNANAFINLGLALEGQDKWDEASFHWQSMLDNPNPLRGWPTREQLKERIRQCKQKSSMEGKGTRLITREALASSVFGLPQHFQGAMILKDLKQASYFFTGEWVDGPKVEQGNSRITWSKKAAKLHDLDLKDKSFYTRTFSIGKREGTLWMRVFDWPDKSNFRNAPATIEDEGPITIRDGLYVLDGVKHLFLFKSAIGSWTPMNSRLFRFRGTEVTPAVQVKPRWSDENPSIWTNTFSFGAYLNQSDGWLGRILFKMFPNNIPMVTRYIKYEGRVYSTRCSFIDHEGKPQPSFKQDPYWAGLYGNGMGNFSAFQYANVVAKFSLDSESKINEVGYGTGENNRNITSYSISGESIEVLIPVELSREILDRSQDLQWVHSGGPFSFSRVFNLALDGSIVVLPLLSLPVRNNYSSFYMDRITKAYQQYLIDLRPFIKDANFKYVSPDQIGPDRPTSLGYLFVEPVALGSSKK